MKALVVFYSRTSTTKPVAESLAQSLNCDSEELIDTKNAAGLWALCALEGTQRQKSSPSSQTSNVIPRHTI